MAPQLGFRTLQKAREVEPKSNTPLEHTARYGAYRSAQMVEGGVGMLAHAVVWVEHDTPEELGESIASQPNKYQNSGEALVVRPTDIPEIARVAYVDDWQDRLENSLALVRFDNLTAEEIARVNEGIKEAKPHLSIEKLIETYRL